jgi:hypothetical protein
MLGLPRVILQCRLVLGLPQVSFGGLWCPCPLYELVGVLEHELRELACCLTLLWRRVASSSLAMLFS